MDTTKFKTNIKCAACVAKVTPFLNEAIGENNWEVDYNNPSKILTVDGEKDNTKVIEALEKAGYKAEALTS
jgi:copper chaperone CopZ